MNIKRLTVILIGLIIVTGLVAHKQNKRYRPKNLDEAITQLDVVYTNKYKKEIFDMSESEYTTKSHYSTGLWIRYNWRLWQSKGLSKYFNDLGIYHPNDMTDIILRCYYRHLHHQAYELNKQIKHYQDRRKKFQKPGEKTKTDSMLLKNKYLN